MATTAEIQTAYRAIVRTDLNATTAAAIASSGIDINTYISGLITQTISTTNAAVGITAFITGIAPTTTQLDALKVEADKQVASYTALGVANPALGAFEAFGRGLAVDTTTTATFSGKYGTLSTADFINTVYIQTFGTVPTVAAAANLTAQINYFTNLYTVNSVPNAALAAKGAVLGQIVGYAFTSAASSNSTFDNQVASFLTATAKGDATLYAKALPAVAGSGTAGATLTLTAGVDSVDSSQTVISLKSTDGDDTIRGLAAGDLATTDVINGGGGVDTLNAVLAAAIAPVLNSVEKVNLTLTADSGLDLGSVKGTTDLTTTGGFKFAATNANVDTNYGITAGVAADVFTITLKDATGTNDTVKLVSTATTAVANVVETFKFDSVENASVTVASPAAGGTHDIAFDATAVSTLKTITISGTATTVNVSSPSALVKGSLTTIDASSLKGGLKFTADAGFTKLTTINGGTTADTIDLTGTTGVKVTGNGGADAIKFAGGIDTAVYKAGTDSTLTSGFDTITAFTTTQDKIDLTALALTNKTVGTSALAQPAGDVDGLFKIAGVTYGLVKIAGGADYAIDVNGDGNFSAATDLYIKGIGTAVLGDFLL